MAASSAENRMNLAALQQCDPYIDDIVQTATQVALYTFNGSANEWEKTDIEGSLFVYSRSASPHNGFMIMNRLSMNNLTEPVTKELEFQHQDPFLLYRNAKSIYGLWFYDKEECARVTRVMNGLVHKVRQRAKAKARQRSVSESSAKMANTAAAVGGGGQPKGVDIMQMLSKAQQEFNQNKQTEPSHVSPSHQLSTGVPTVVRPIPVKANDRVQQKKQQQQPKGQKSSDNRSSGEIKGMVVHSARHQQQVTQQQQVKPQQRQQPRFNRSVSMQEPSGQSDMPPALQKLLQLGVSQGNIDHPLTKGEVLTVGSLEKVHSASGDFKAGRAPPARSEPTKQEQREEGKFMTVESIENKATGSLAGKSAMDGVSEGQSVPIQNLLAQLNKSQPPPSLQQQQSTTEGGTAKLQPSATDAGLSRVLSQGNQPLLMETDMTQTLLANLKASKSSSATTGLLLPGQITQGGSLPSSPAGKGMFSKPLLGAAGGSDGYEVPSLQQIAAGGMQPLSSNALLQSLQSPQKTTGGSTSPMLTSPQRIPASVAPPTLLTPQAFRQRAQSDAAAVASSLSADPLQQLLCTSSPRSSHSGIMDMPRGGGTAPLVNPMLKIDPLTKEQFQEAFIHLIRTDADFSNKLYAAYIATQK